MVRARLTFFPLALFLALFVAGSIRASAQETVLPNPLGGQTDNGRIILAGDSVVLGAQPVLKWPPDGWTVDSLTPSLRWQSDGYSQLWVAPKASSAPIVELVVPKGQDSYTIATPLTPGAVYRWRVRSNPYPPGQSIYTWGPWSPEITFSTPSGLSWKDSASIRLVSPVNGTISSTITPTLSWVPPAGATHFEMIITPAGNEAASVRFVNNISPNYAVPGPPAWYGMLPDTLYYWRVRVNDAPGAVPEDHPSWGPWSEAWSFRTPIPSSDIISPVSPRPQEAVASTTPTLAWQNASDHVFYYEIQISKDPKFIVDPQLARAPLYWETIHGGLTTPKNSYAVSKKYPLERGQLYYWRVRPAVPLRSQPTGWSPTWSFSVP